MRLDVIFGLSIPEEEIEIEFVRSSGPGGQNVNKVNSKAILRWNLATSPSVGETLRARLLEKLAHRLTRGGDLIVTSDRHRDQPRNREDAIEKLRALLKQAAHRDPPRRSTEPTRGSKKRRAKAKTQHSEKKASRQKVRI